MHSQTQNRLPENRWPRQAGDCILRPKINCPRTGGLRIGGPDMRMSAFSDPKSYRYHYRSPSPIVYRSSLSERLADEPWSLRSSDRITDRVVRAIRRNQSLDNLDRLGMSTPTPRYVSKQSIFSFIDLKLPTYCDTHRSDVERVVSIF